MPAESRHVIGPLTRTICHRGTEGGERTGKASGCVTILTGLNLTHCDFRLVCRPLCSLWLCGGSFWYRTLSGLTAVGPARRMMLAHAERACDSLTIFSDRLGSCH
jgi:hypothetical protein